MNHSFECKDFIAIGGGAAGLFAAIIAKTNHPEKKVLLLEKTAVLLSKVKISGGGRCNVTHHCLDPNLLIHNYPRGGRELLGPFHTFGPRETIRWFEERGALLKTEKDGRMFPITDSSQTIIDTLMREAAKVGVEIHLRQKVDAIQKNGSHFEITLSTGEILKAEKLLLATGSSPQGYQWAQALGHTLQPPVPSLFTFNVPTSPLKELSGVCVNPVELALQGTKFTQTGSLLITHFGFSGPAALKLSAYAARYLHEQSYKVTLIINWLPKFKLSDITEKLYALKQQKPHLNLFAENPFYLPKNLWKKCVETLPEKVADISLKQLRCLAEKLHADPYTIEGKTTNKEEFVTCGGITLKEVNFKTMESKCCPGLYFAGEILDIDGITGGFNFQNAWTTGFLAGNGLIP